MSTSRKTSTTYSRSSFDAMESTRRLSDGLTTNDKTGGAALLNGKGVFEEDNLYIPRLSKSSIEDEKEKDRNFNLSNDDAVLKGDCSRKESYTSNEAGFTSSSLGSFAKGSSSDTNGDKIKEDNNYIVEDDEDDEGNDNDNRDDDKNNADQRSESDSDLDTPDDFDGDVYMQYESFERTQTMGGNEKDQKPTLCNDTTHKPIFREVDLTNRIIARSNFITSSDIESVNNENLNVSNQAIEQQQQQHQHQQQHQQKKQQQQQNHNYHHQHSAEKEKPNPNTIENYKINPSSDNIGLDKLDTQRTSDSINSDDIYSKIHDNDVIEHSEKLDEVKDITFGNMDKLQHLDKTDPALRRLFMRPRVTPAETKSVRVDPDIKSMVNEFLKTNVTENFIIARVLRENYALFYSWLASHMQTERNAWAVRLGHALDNADNERKGSLESRNAVVEAATRLRTLVMTVSDSLYGIQDKSINEKPLLFQKGPSLRHGHVKGFQSVKGGGGARKTVVHYGHTLSPIDDKSIKNNQQLNTNSEINRSVEDISTMLRQSSFNMIEVCEPTNYESDPGTGKYSYSLRKRFTNINSNKNNKNITPSSSSKYVGNLSHNHKNNSSIGNKHYNSYCSKPESECESMPFGYTIHGTVVKYDDDTDWKQVLSESIDVLTEICDTFLVDRKACLRLISSKSSQHESLVDALSNFIQDNQSRDYIKRKEIEKRLKLLEMENKTMQKEVIMLKKTLLDKSEDALNLQSHLNRLESMVNSNKAEKVDKSVGTKWEEFMSPRVHLAITKNGKTSKMKSPNFGVGGDKHKGENHKLNKSHKLQKSPYALPGPPIVNGTAPSKPVPNSKINGIKNGYDSDASDSPILLSQNNDNKASSKENVDETQVPMQRQQSFIELSEEKLEKLKHRAKKLEDSLHDAINSMDTLNKATPWMDKSNSPSERPTPIAHIQKVKAAGNHHQTAKNIAYWNKSSFGVTSSIPNRQRIVGTINNTGTYQYQKKHKEPTPTEIGINLRSENSSLLEGRSLHQGVQINSDLDMDNGTVTSLKLVTDRSQGLTPRSTGSRYDGYHSDDDGRSTRQQQLLQQQSNDLSARSEISHKVRARRSGQVKQIVSKCLRCQKLFSPTDNHKLSCCYHSKAKERLEHYDHMGMLVKVIYVWKCCHQPQEADGCTYGKHV